MNTVNADGLRGAIQDLDDTIRHARTCIRNDHARKDEFLGEYLRLVRRVHDMQIARQAESNIVLAICSPFLPMPFVEQIVGANKFNREWGATHMAVPPVSQVAPVVAKQLAA